MLLYYIYFKNKQFEGSDHTIAKLELIIYTEYCTFTLEKYTFFHAHIEYL